MPIHPDVITTLHQYKRIWLCWWGTWWHVYPISSLIQYIQSSDKINSKIQDYYRLGWKDQMEAQECRRLQQTKSLTQLHFLPLVSGKMRRYLDLQNIALNTRDIFKVLVWTMQALFYLWRYNIDVIFCKGWYMALPVVLASMILRIPLYIHESDSHYGLTHRIARHWAKKIWLGMSTADTTADDRITVTWQILSPELDQEYPIPPEVLRLQQRYPRAYPIIVTPGSLGSQTIFDQLIEIIPHCRDRYIWYIICGTLNTSYMSHFAQFPQVCVYAQATPWLMGCLYRQSQGAIVRWGVTTLAECHYFGLKTLACPLAHTHDQVDNIKYYSTLYPQQFFCKTEITIDDIQQIFC